MTQLLLRPDQGREAFNVHFRVRVPATARGEAIRRAWQQHLERTRTGLAKQGYEFIGPSPVPPVGPFPIYRKLGFPTRPQGGVRGTNVARDQDAASRVETLPLLTKDTAHLLAEEVEWEFCALFHRPALRTEVVRPSTTREERRFGGLYSKQLTRRMAA